MANGIRYPWTDTKLIFPTTTSKYYLEALGNDGLNKLLAPYEDKRADAVCTFAFSMEPTSEPLLFQGRLEVCIQFEILKIEHCTNSLHRARLFPQEVPPSLVRAI